MTLLTLTLTLTITLTLTLTLTLTATILSIRQRPVHHNENLTQRTRVAHVHYVPQLNQQ